MLHTEYETTLVLRPDMAGDAIEAALDKVRGTISEDGGSLIAINHWGKKRLAYEINKQNRGIYIHTHYLAGNKVVAELERNFRINESILRFLTVQLNTKVAVDDRAAVDYVKPDYNSQEAQDVTEEKPAEEVTTASAESADANSTQEEVAATKATESTNVTETDKA